VDRESPAANASDRAGWHAAASPPRRSGVATAAAARVAARAEREIEVGGAAADAIGILKAKRRRVGGWSGGGVRRESGRKEASGAS
jgi:hypothetical protein